MEAVDAMLVATRVPEFMKTEMVLELLLATARSALPSPLKSALVTERELEPVG